MKTERPLITTILQLRMVSRILKLTELKKEDNGWIYPTEVTIPLKIKYSALQSYLDKLEKRGIIRRLSHTVRTEWGGVFRLTEKGKTELLKEMNGFLRL